MLDFLSTVFHRKAQIPALPPAPDCAHLVVDCQRLFADPTYIYNMISLSDHDTPQSLGTRATAKAAATIAAAMPAFRAAGVHTMVAYLDEFNVGAEKAWGGFYKIKAQPEDTLLPKASNSVFETTPLETILENKKIRHLLVSGYTAGSCVLETVTEALGKGIGVTLLKDCLGQTSRAKSTVEEEVSKMVALGARAVTAKQAISAFARNPAASPADPAP